MKLAVVMPVYNTEGTLAVSIESIINQTHRDWILIVYDDGSTDATADVAASYALKDSRIRLVRAPHRGIVASLVAACELVDTDYFARMDGDDVAHPERFAKQLAVMESDPRIGLCGTGVKMTGARVAFGRKRYETWINGLLSHEDMAREVFVECPVAHPTFMLSRRAYEAVGGYRDFGWAEDYDLVFRLLTNDFRLAKVAQPLLDWTESPHRLSMTDDRYSPRQFRNVKRHYLFQSYLKNAATFLQWGAGEVGKKWLREWGSNGQATTTPAFACSRPQAVVDINPRKVGATIHGVSVISPESLPQPGTTRIVVAVGTPGARDEIRNWMSDHGYLEGQDFIFLA